ncbi:MAG: hypothetical protein Q8R12_03530 [bacterium]|nr:hypothetical protein [bacterium]
MTWKIIILATVGIAVSLFVNFWQGNSFTASITERIDAGKMGFVERVRFPGPDGE